MNPAMALMILCDMVFLSLDHRNKPGLEAVAKTAVETLRSLVEEHEKKQKDTNDGDQREPTNHIG